MGRRSRANAPSSTTSSRIPPGPPWAEPVAGQPLTFRTTGQRRAIEMVPLYRVHGEKYAVYWNVKKG